MSLRDAAEAVLAAWDDYFIDGHFDARAIEALRAALAADAAHGGDRAQGCRCPPGYVCEECIESKGGRRRAPSPEAEGPRCETCGGSGMRPANAEPPAQAWWRCDACNGTGRSGGKP